MSDIKHSPSSSASGGADVDSSVQDDFDDYVVEEPKKRRLNGKFISRSLVSCLVLVGVFYGGIWTDKHYGTQDTPGGGAQMSAMAGNRNAGNQQSGQTASGQSTGSTSATVGTVSVVDGNTVYVTDSSGNTVKVSVSDSIKVTRSVEGTVADLAAGQSVVITGTTGEDGTVTATAVREGTGGGNLFGGGMGGPPSTSTGNAASSGPSTATNNG